MRRVASFLLVVLLALVAVTSSLAQPPADKGDVKLKVFVHNPHDERGKPGPKPAVCDSTTNDGVADYGLAGWHLSGTVDYQVNYSSIPGSVQDSEAAIDASFDTWATAAGAGVHFHEGSSTPINVARYDGVNVVAWGRVSGNAIAVTYIWYYPSTGEVAEVDTIMSARLPWSYTSPTDLLDPDLFCGDLYSYDAQNILTHEVGHWVGLNDLYEGVDEDLTMYGYGAKGELKKDTLGYGDKLGLDVLY